jgi:CRISPR-associated protein Cmr6
MSRLPYPLAMGCLLRLDDGANRSLVWDRGVDVYEPSWQIPKDNGKSGFLTRFRDTFAAPPDYPSFVERRRRALARAGARCVPMACASRLVVGLGLPHPFETGLLLDRLTGCPYLPGSSVKGLVRAAARRVAAGDLAGEREFWSRHFDELLGPDVAGGPPAAKGKAIFDDAFPERWPRLELDVLTPHYREYYEKGVPPGDWFDPVPLPFLTIADGTVFLFHFRLGESQAGEEGLDRIAELLETALDWLGIGGKKASGYGTFMAPPAAPMEKETGKPKKGVVLRKTSVR